MTDYDYVIVGSGVAASTVAKSLLEHDRSTSILLLEAGPEVPARDRRSWWDYVVNDVQPYAYCYDQPGETASLGNTTWEFDGSRVMAYGGSTMHWGGWCLRYKPEDFWLRTNTGAGGDWPFTYDDLEPYYCRAEHHLSVCGDDTEGWTKRSEPYPRPPFPWTAADGEMIEAMQRLDIKPGKMPVARYRKCMTTGTCKYCPFGARFSGQYVNDDLRADPRHVNFEIKTGTPATQILLSSKSKVSGIEYLDTESGETKVAIGRRYVIAAGAYESPKLLLRSTSSHWENGVGNAHDQVGRYVVTHSILVVRGRNTANPEAWIQPYDFPTLMSRTYDTEEYQKDGKIFLFKNRALPNVDIAGLMRAGKTRAEIDAIIRGPRLQEMQAFLEEKGYPDNQLKLAPGKNRFGLPKTTISFSRHQSTLTNAERRLDLMQAVIEEMGYEVVKRSLDDPGGHHTSGTCRMAATPEEGVTDANLQVFGMDNLWICSNAVFPSGAAVNPTLTLTAISMRLADHFIGLGA